MGEKSFGMVEPFVFEHRLSSLDAEPPIYTRKHIGTVTHMLGCTQDTKDQVRLHQPTCLYMELLD